MVARGCRSNNNSSAPRRNVISLRCDAMKSNGPEERNIRDKVYSTISSLVPVQRRSYPNDCGFIVCGVCSDEDRITLSYFPRFAQSEQSSFRLGRGRLSMTFVCRSI